MSDRDERWWTPALDELGHEFRWVAGQELARERRGRSLRRQRTSALVAVALIVAAFAFLRDGGSDADHSALAAVRTAPIAAARAGSVRFTARLVQDGRRGDLVTTTTGALDFAQGRYAMSTRMTIPDRPAAPTVHRVAVNRELYVRVGAGGWKRSTGQRRSFSVDGLPSAGPAGSPIEALGLMALLAHAPAKPAGVEHVAGRHYRFITKLASMPKARPGRAPIAGTNHSRASSDAQARAPLVGRASIAFVDVWLDDKGRPRRAVERFLGIAGQAGSRVTMQFVNYGRPVEISPPRG